MDPEAGAQLGSDAELITRVRVGDTAAFGELYRRHAAAATALARQVARSPAEADDLVSESFARVLDGLKAGGGPDTAFRAYLFTTLRHTAYDRTRKDSRLKFTDDMEAHETPVDAPDPVIAMAENGMVGKAFASLPERWQAVLWHTQVEGMSPAETGVLLGMSANAVTSLAFRAREGLREAYLQAHLAETAQQQCRWTTDRLGAWARGGLSKREQTMVDAHLETCDHCAALAAELTEINSSLRSILAPLLLGGLAAGYLTALGPVGVLAQAGAMFGTGSAVGTASAAPTFAAAGAAGGAAGGAHAASTAMGFTRRWAAVGTGVAAAVVAAVVAVIVATAGGSSPTNPADAVPGSPVSSTSTDGGGAGTGGTGANGSGASGANGTGGSGTNGTGGSGTNGTGGSGTNGTGASGTNGTGASGTNGTGASGADGTEGSTGSAPTEGGTGNQPGGPGQLGTTDGPGSADQPGTDDGLPGDSTTPPGEDGQPASEPNNIPPPLVPTTTTGQGTSQQPTPGSPQQQTSAPTTRASSPTSGTHATQAPTTQAPTTQAPTTRSTSRPTTPTTRSTTPTTSTTSTSPAAPNVAISVGAFSASAGGSIVVQVDADNRNGTGASAGGTVVVNAPGVTLGGSAAGLRARTAQAFVPAVAIADCSVVVAATSCSLPAVAAGQSLHTSFTLTIGLDAQLGSLTVSWGNAFSKKVDFDIEPGIRSLTVVDAEGQTPTTLQVGRPTLITLAAGLATGVDTAGAITLPTRSGGIWIRHYPDTCTESAGRLTCHPVVGEGKVVTYGPFTVTVMPDASTDDSLSVTVPNGDGSGIPILGGGTGIKIARWDPSTGTVDWTGPFGGETVGSETMRCSARRVERALCQFPGVAFMQDIQPVKQTEYQRKLSVPVGATVQAARLTWVASAPAKAGSLDAATLVVRRGGTVTAGVIKGSVGACAGKTDPCPTIRYADVSALVQGADTVWLEPLAASRTTQRNGLTPMAAWSLNLVWLQPDSTETTHVQIAADVEFSWSGVKEDTVELAPEADADLTDLSGAVWAADPWADKNVVVGGRPLVPPPTMSGVDQDGRRTGFDLLHLDSKDLAGSAAGVQLTNTETWSSRDQLWIGPLLIIRSVPDS